MELEAKLEIPAIIGKQNQLNHLLIKLKTPPAVANEQRQPLVIGLAIDKSWSMKGEKIESVIDAASALVNWLTRNDYICIVAYSADVQVVQPLIQLKDKISVIDKIRAIMVGTSTNLSGGWLQALRLVESSNVPNSYKRVILLTDGQATLGVKDQEQFNAISSSHFSRGISTTTIGFGNDFNESSLKDIASTGGGNFYFVNSPEEASGIFFREFGDVGSLYGQAVEVKLQFPDGVRVMELYNDYPAEISDNGTTVVQMGDIRADDVRNLVLSLEINPARNLPLDNLIDVQLSFYNLFEKMRLETVLASISTRSSENSVAADQEVIVERLIYSSAKTIMRAAKLLQEKEVDMAKNIVNYAIERLEEKINLSPEVLNSVLIRLKFMSNKLKENAFTASKHFLAAGTDIFNRSEIIDTGGIETHDQIFEHPTYGDIDLYKCPDLKSIVQNQMKDGFKYVIFDLKETKFIDSSGIGALIQIAGWLRRRGGELVVCNISESVKRVFEVTRLENHIRVASDNTQSFEIIESIVQASKK
jgi:Ca-activated chloride channel family protein